MSFEIEHSLKRVVPSKILIVCFLLSWYMPDNATARTITVNSIASLQAAINTAQKGDVIILADSTYSNAGLISVAANEITVKAATSGGVIFNGNSRFTISGNNNTLMGFQFKNGNIGIKELLEVTGSYNTITQCNFYYYVAYHYVHFSAGGHHNELSYSNIEGKPVDPVESINSAVQLSISPKVVAHYKISHCTFLNFPGIGGDQGNEPIRIGLGVEQNNTSGTIVEYCYFENTGLGDSESISLKSTWNVIRYNTFNNNPKGQLVFRTGNKNSAYGNFFINSGGIRIKEGGNHMVYNNYFQGSAELSSLELMNFKLNQKTKVGEPLDTIYIYHNTLYNPGVIELGGKGDNPPKNVLFANNIFYKESGTLFTNLNSNVSFLNNLFYGTASLGFKAISQEFKNSDLKMILNSVGYYSLSAQSPAINASNGSYPSIIINPVTDNEYNLLLDIEGQARPADKKQKDIGCDEFTTGKVINHPLKRPEAGPSYLTTVTEIVQPLNKTKDLTKPFVKDTSSFENDFFKISKNSASSKSGTRVVVALSELKIKIDQATTKIDRGQIHVLKNDEIAKLSKGEYFEVLVKSNHPKLTPPESWLEPQKNTILYDDDQIRVFEERLEPGDKRKLHSHAQRIVVRLNEVKMTDPRYEESKVPGAGLQIPNTAKYAESVVHETKNLSQIPLFNIVIEYKIAH